MLCGIAGNRAPGSCLLGGTWSLTVRLLGSISDSKEVRVLTSGAKNVASSLKLDCQFGKSVQEIIMLQSEGRVVCRFWYIFLFHASCPNLYCSYAVVENQRHSRIIQLLTAKKFRDVETWSST